MSTPIFDALLAEQSPERRAVVVEAVLASLWRTFLAELGGEH